MSILFTPVKIGSMTLKNRIVHSATYECMADEKGAVTDSLIHRYRTLAQGEVGLIIPGKMYVEQEGKALPFQTAIHSDDMIPGLRRLVNTVHEQGGKIVFQLAHAGRQTLKKVTGKRPIGPSAKGRDPSLFVKPREMMEDDIQRVIAAFIKAAARAAAAGADGIQLQGAHGYLINEFLSPFFNVRTDRWGGTDQNRFRFLEYILKGLKAATPDNIALLVKLNGNDHTPQTGITPELASLYAEKLVELGIDGVEISCGTMLWSFMNSCRGDVPVDELVLAAPTLLRPLGRLMMNRLKGRYGLEEAYNQENARVIRPALGRVPLILVGGMRTVRVMEEVLENGDADLISMSRPFIREPYLVKKIREGRTDRTSCTSCNRCFQTFTAHVPLQCRQ